MILDFEFQIADLKEALALNPQSDPESSGLKSTIIHQWCGL